MKKIFFILFSIFASLNPINTDTLFSVFDRTAEASSLYYILDASGSMWGRVDGEMKIEAARNSMTKLMNQMPEDMLFGLTVYGQQRKGDCSDIVELIPLGKTDRSKAIEMVEKIKPKGKTPIAATIEKTVQTLNTKINTHKNKKQPKTQDTSQNPVKTDGEQATIVLISDGIETCEGDPCASTAALKSAGINFIMHVVGFDVDKNASEQLACIAQAGGGKYFSTQNAGELLSALSQVHKSIIEKVSITELKQNSPEVAGSDSLSKNLPPLPAKIEQKITKNSKSVRIKATGPGKIKFRHDSWLKTPYSWKLIAPETGEEMGKFSTLETTLVTPGVYQLVWDQYQHESSDVVLTEVVNVEPGKTVEIPLLTAIELNLPSWIAPPYYWGLKDTQTLERVVTFTKLEPFLVPAGEYEVVWRQGEHSAQEVALQKVNIIPDRLNRVTVGTSINPVKAEWVQEKVHYWGLKPIDKTNAAISSGNTKEFVACFSDNFAPQLVPPGKYQFIYDISEHGSSDSVLGEIDVVEGVMNDFHINTGIKLIPSQGMEPPYFIEFIALNLTGGEINKVRLNGSFGPVALKPGQYKINYRQKEHGSSTMTIIEKLDLEEGNLVEIEL